MCLLELGPFLGIVAGDEGGVQSLNRATDLAGGVGNVSGGVDETRERRNRMSATSAIGSASRVAPDSVAKESMLILFSQEDTAKNCSCRPRE